MKSERHQYRGTDQSIWGLEAFTVNEMVNINQHGMFGNFLPPS